MQIPSITCRLITSSGASSGAQVYCPESLQPALNTSSFSNRPDISGGVPCNRLDICPNIRYTVRISNSASEFGQTSVQFFQLHNGPSQHFTKNHFQGCFISRNYFPIQIFFLRILTLFPFNLHTSKRKNVSTSFSSFSRFHLSNFSLKFLFFPVPIIYLF